MADLKKQNLYELIAHNDNFQIPIYQRNYDWDEGEIIGFFNDIFDNYKRNESNKIEMEETEYYLGNIIFYRHNLKKEQKEVMMIVDGQQRITSTIIIFSVLRKIIKYEYEKNRNNLDSYSDDNYKDLLYKIEKLTIYRTKDKSKIKLTNLDNNNLLQDICLWEIYDKNIFENENYKKFNILKNFNSIEKELKKIIYKENIINFSDLISYFKKIIHAFEKTLIAQVQIFETKDQPSKIFETINTAGRKLKPSDLIKSYIFFHAHDEMFTLSQTYINKVEEKLKNIKEYKDLSNWYRHIISIFNTNNYLYSKGIQIYKGFKETFASKNSLNIFDKNYDYSNIEDVEELISFLIKNASITEKINNLINNKKCKEEQIIYNKIFEDSWGTFYPLLHNLVFKYFEKSTYDKYDFICEDDSLILNEIANIAKLSIHIAFSGTNEKNITRGPATLYSRYKNDINKHSNNFWDWIKEEKRHEDQIFAYKKDELKSRIESASIYQNSSKKGKILLAAIEGLLTNFEIKIDELLSDYQIEHIYPQVPSKKASDEYLNYFNGNVDEKDKFYNNIIHTIGNLTLVKPKTNNELDNNSWSEKKKLFHEKSTLKINQNLSKYDKWDKLAYKDRTNFISNKLINFLEI